MALKATMPGGLPQDGSSFAATAESPRSAVSWGAILGGATVATAVTVMLTALGAGIGLSAVSPLAHDNPSPAAFTVISAIWLIIIQWLSSGFGGYITGRMRTKWTELHTNEVFFRDTANGFIAWAVSSLLVVLVLASATTGLVDRGAHAAGAALSDSDVQQNYMIDVLLRPDQAAPVAPAVSDSADAQAREEVSTLLAANALGSISDQDRAYLAQLVARTAHVPPTEAEQRVTALVAARDKAAQQAKKVADAARKATSSFMMFSFVSMLIGAFIACVAAAYGGRERDI